MLKWLGRALVTLAVLLVAAGVVVWIGSERVLRKSYADVVVAAPKLAGNVESGKHWAAILGCSGCHGPTLHGNVIYPDSFLFGALVAPNLTIKRKQYDDAQLARMIRFGIRRDGTGVQLMPSQAFYHLDDQTVADLIAFVRSVPDDDQVLPESGNGVLTRWNLLTGAWKLTPELVPRGSARLGDSPHAVGIERGRYIATVACGECHGLDQKGDPNAGMPNLAVAKAYSLDDFKALMHGGVGLGGRKLQGMMAGAIKWRFTAFTDDELVALKEYLDARTP
ncbi:MAG TPA: cytochrome c [Rudaea sp.]|nr:cytochrome c [Rudaea sp.]